MSTKNHAGSEAFRIQIIGESHLSRLALCYSPDDGKPDTAAIRILLSGTKESIEYPRQQRFRDTRTGICYLDGGFSV